MDHKLRDTQRAALKLELVFAQDLLTIRKMKPGSKRAQRHKTTENKYVS